MNTVKKHLLKVPIVRHVIRAFVKPNPNTRHLTKRQEAPRLNYANHGAE